MSQPRKWWWGFLLVVLIWVLSNLWINPGVRDDLQQRTAQALADASVGVDVAGRDVAIGGVRLDAQQQAAAQQTAAQTWGVRKVWAGPRQAGEIAAVKAADQAADSPTGVAPDYGFDARLDEGTLTLSGQVADDAARASVLALVAKLFPGVAVNDRLQVAAQVPQGAMAALTTGLRELSRLVRGGFSLKGTQATLTGEARYAQAVAAIDAAFGSGMPEGFTASVGELTVAPAQPAFDAAACQQQARALLENTRILFVTGKASISKNSSGLLDQIVAIFARCPAVKVEIAGHTDATGDAARNMTLSQQRAQAVLTYLVNAGLSADNFETKGYGDTQPVADNATVDGRARNRRIAFTVQQ